jgi:hypothetical protein
MSNFLHISRAALILVSAVACTSSGTKTGDTAAAGQAAASLDDSSKMIVQNLKKFDRLDFEAFSNQNWDLFKDSHAADIVVTWPDGHETKGLEKHIEDLKAMFVHMPDLKIVDHPIRIANGSWTAVTGRMTGTFTKPMPLGNGKSVPPTNKKLDMTMATIGHWTAAGVMDHEWLYWDNATYMKQLGISQ